MDNLSSTESSLQRHTHKNNIQHSASRKRKELSKTSTGDIEKDINNDNFFYFEQKLNENTSLTT